MALYQYFIYQADKFSERQISKDQYKASDLVEVKIPVHLPVVGNWVGYQNISGSVQLAQNCYNYVRMKVTQDTLYVMCIPNSKTTSLNKANIIFAREVSEAPFNTKKQNLPVKSINWFKYFPAATVAKIAAVEFTVEPTTMRLNTATISNPIDVTGQPPEGLIA